MYGFDAVTVAPYMGEDSIRPFLNYKDKWTIVLGLTSNEGSKDFEQLKLNTGHYLYEEVMQKVASWGSDENLMFVVGATKPEQLAGIRKMFPHHFFLVPGVGAQGGDLKEVLKAGLNNDGGLLINVSRAIIYAGNNENFGEAAGIAARQYADEMREYL